jgi:DnaJ-class molecular chaperone
VRQYNASRIIEHEEFDTAEEAYELLTKKELKDPYCIYENISKKDDYKFGGFDDKMEWIKKIKDMNEDENNDNIPLICVKVRINIETRSKKILDYWFE